MNHPEKMEQAYKNEIYGYSPGLAGSVLCDVKFGRFRPAAWLWVKIQSNVFRDNSFAWRLTNVLILFLSLVSLSMILRKFGVKLLTITVILAFYTFGRNNETWWALIPPAQNIGELFLLSGFYFLIRFREKEESYFSYLSSGLFLLSALSKECFIFCIPFVILIDYFFLNLQKKIFTKEYLVLFSTFLIPFTFLLTFNLNIKHTYGYASPDSVSYIVGYNILQHLFSSLFLIAPLIMIAFHSYKITVNKLIILSLISFGWLMVQLILLKGILMNEQHHYLVPGILILIIISGIALETIKTKSKRMFVFLLSIYLLFAVSQGKNTYINCGFFTAENIGYQRMCEKIALSSPKKIIYVTNQAISGDWITGTSAILRSLDVKSALHFCSLSDSIADWQLAFTKTRPTLGFPIFNNKTDSLCSGDWLIFPENVCNIHSFPWDKYKCCNNLNNKGKNPAIEVGANHVSVTEKNMIYFGNKYHDLSFKNILKLSRKMEYAGFYAMRVI